MWTIVDGNNLQYAVIERGHAPSVGREQLCRVLAQWRRHAGGRLTVVFDGAPPPQGVARQMTIGGVSVRFSGPRTADDVIEDMVSESNQPHGITVVTTDRAIQHAVKYQRAKCIDAEVFADALYRPDAARQTDPSNAPADRRDAPEEKPAPPGPNGTDSWIEHFGPGLDELRDDLEDMM